MNQRAACYNSYLTVDSNKLHQEASFVSTYHPSDGPIDTSTHNTGHLKQYPEKICESILLPHQEGKVHDRGFELLMYRQYFLCSFRYGTQGDRKSVFSVLCYRVQGFF